MANQHMMTAASNLENALNDLRLYKGELQAQYDNARREIDRRLNEIQNQRTMHATEMARHTDASNAARHSIILKQLQDEENQLKQQESDLKRETDKLINAADQNASAVSGFVSQVRSMAQL